MNLLTKAIAQVGRKSLVGWPAPGWPPSSDYIATVGGQTVTTETVLGVAAAWSCVTLLARSVARLPLFTYRQVDDRNKTIDKAHRLYQLLHLKPNPHMTSFSWRSASQGHLETWGNSYSEIERDGLDRIIGLHPRHPRQWRPDWKAGKKVYYYTQPDTGREVELAAERVFHIPAFSPDGIMGYAPVTLHRKGFALTTATESYGIRQFENDVRPGTILQHPKTLSDTALKHIVDSLRENHAGTNAGGMAILEEGMTLKEFGFPPEDAQFLETRKFQREEAARIFGIPPGFEDSADEGMAIKFVVHALGHRLVMWEQEIKRQLIGDEADVFAEFAVEGLLRGNTAARFAAYATGRTNGWLSVNEIRGWENLNPVEGGDDYITPLNMQPLGGSEGSPARNPSPSTGNPNSPGAMRDTVPLEATQPSRNGRTEVPV